MGMNGDGDKTTSQSCNLNGDEPKGIRKGALLLCLGTPSQWPPLYFLLVNRILAKETFSMPKTRQSCNNRWGWRFLPSPLEFTEPNELFGALFITLSGKKKPSGRPGSFRKESLFLFIHSKIEIMDFRSIIFGLFSNLNVDSDSIGILIEDSS